MSPMSSLRSEKQDADIMADTDLPDFRLRLSLVASDAVSSTLRLSTHGARNVDYHNARDIGYVHTLGSENLVFLLTTLQKSKHT